MCSSRKILWSLLLLSLLEVGLGVASIVLGAVGIYWVREEHQPQQGDASPVWSGLCVGAARRLGVEPADLYKAGFSLCVSRNSLGIKNVSSLEPHSV